LIDREESMDKEMPKKLQLLRKRSNLSIRQLAEMAGVSRGFISCIERGSNSPSIAVLQRILHALGTDLPTFFAGNHDGAKGPVFLREQMRSVSDGRGVRTYTILFPPGPDIHVEMLDETLLPSKRPPPFEILNCDMAGYILSGGLRLEIKHEPTRTLRPGDAFYVPQGTEHRGYAAGGEPVRLVTVSHPANY
jgi:transcriptional regulator with XRE-family HTH domain